MEKKLATEEIRNNEEFANKTITLLSRLYQSHSKRILVSEVLSFFKTEFEFDAVGIRLRDGVDFPYYDSVGFTGEFKATENTLCYLDEKGEPVRDEIGNPILECWCGNVLNGKFDPSEPFFTEFGSFITNNSSMLTESAKGSAWLSGKRNLCIKCGYESIALIPLSYSGKIHGLLQLNDKRKGRFTDSFRRFLENLSFYISVTLDRIYIEENLVMSRDDVKKARDHFEMLFDMNPDAVHIIRLNDGIITDVNEVFCTLGGYQKEEMIGKTIMELKLWTDQTHWDLILKDLTAKGYCSNFETVLRRKDNTEFPVLISSRLFYHNHSPNVISITKDITELKMVQKKLLDSELKYRSVFEKSVVPIWEEDFSVVNEEFKKLRSKGVKNFRTYFDKHPDAVVQLASLVKIVEMNEKSLVYFGVKRKDELSRNLNNFFTKDSITTFCDEMTDLANGKKEFEARIPIQLFSGEIRHVHLILNVQPGYYDTLSRVLVSWIDITDTEKYEEALRNSSEILRTLNRHLEEAREEERSKISLNLHDDLGQKITAIKMDLNWISKRYGVQSPLVSDKMKGIETILDNSIKTIQKISSDLRPAVLYDLGLPSALEWFLNERVKPLEINCKLKISPPDMTIDIKASVAIFRIFQESVTNIMRHSQADKINISLVKSSNSVTFIVKDNGKGMNMDDLNISESLGLLGMKERAKSIGGELEIKSRPGSGTSIKVIVPVL